MNEFWEGVTYDGLVKQNLKTNRYLCIYVTKIKPNFHERFRADNGKNRNMPTKRTKTSLLGYALSWCHILVLFFKL